MSRLVLHRAFGSPAARSVQMLGELIGVQLEIKEVNLMKLENKAPGFTKLNPMCTVPVLEDGDFILSESHAIMKYLVAKYGGEKGEQLYPKELLARSIVDQCLFFNAGMFFASAVGAARDTLSGKITQPSSAHIEGVERSYSVLEAYLTQRKYVAANHLTLADLSTGSTATAAQVILKLDTQKYPHCADWMSRLQEEHVFKTINAPGSDFFIKMITRAWEKNLQRLNKSKK